MKLSKRILSILPSATMGVAAKASALKSEGKPVISFSLGEPDFDSPKSALNAAIDAINRGETHYTLSSGITELRKEICNYYKKRFNLDYEVSEVIVSSGAKPILYEAIQTLVDPDDEVLLFAPSWVSYVEQLHLTGGKEVLVDTITTDLIPTKEALQNALSPKTVGIILNSPSNPSGAVYDEKTMKMIADFVRENDLWIIFDEIYERLTYEPAKHVNILTVAPDLRDKVIIINGTSKAYAMTGWRIGYACGHADALDQMKKIHQYAIMCSPTTAQYAAIEALKNGEPEIRRMKEEYNRRRLVMVDGFRKIGLNCFEPVGAFYVFPDISVSGLVSDEFCERLLMQERVLMVPGNAFGACGEGFVRATYATSIDNIREALVRIRRFLESL